MEATSESSKIHCSQATADCLIKSGKGSWLTKRSDPIEAKSKGHMQTYWITPSGNHAMSATGSTTSTVIQSPMIGDLEELYGSISNSNDDTFYSGGSNSGDGGSGPLLLASSRDSNTTSTSTRLLNVASTRFNSRTRRLIEWNTETLSRFLLEIVVRRRQASSGTKHNNKRPSKQLLDGSNISTKETELSSNHVFLHEVKEIIELPDLDNSDATTTASTMTHPTKLGDDVTQQLREYVTCIASMYRKNSFHNFEVSTTHTHNRPR